jgi:hypothetical protein
MTMDPLLNTNQRIYLQVKRGDAGRVKVTFSRLQPQSGAMVALLSRGSIATDGMTIDLVSDPAADTTLRGLSAYQLARQEGYGGTLTAWLASLVGAAGADAYAIARELGYGGTKTQWIASLKGAPASAYLGSVTVAQTATAILAAGVRRVPVTVPTGLGVAAGDALTFCPTAVAAGYAVHDVVAVSATSLNFGVSGPLLAIGAAMPPIAGKLFRLNA